MVSKIPVRTAQIAPRLTQARLISTSSIRFNSSNAQEIEKLNLLIKKKIVELEEAERKKQLDSLKPKLSDFKRPILLTLVIGSTAYLSLHLLWWKLEYNEREKELKKQLNFKEEELKRALEESGQTGVPSSKNPKSFWSRLRIW